MGQLDEETYCFFSVKEYFADLINAGCFDGRQVVSADALEQLSERTQEERDRKRKSLYRDVHMKLIDGASFILLATENLARIDREIPVRIMRYNAAEYGKQLDELHRYKRKQRKEAGLKRNRWAEMMDAGDRLHPVYTVCFYHGAGRWNGPRSLKDVMDFGNNIDEWERFFSDYRIMVINAEDPRVASKCKTEVRQFLNVMCARRDREKLGQLLRDAAYENLSRETARIIAVMANVSSLLENEEKYRNQEGGGYNMCQAMKELQEEFKEEGRAEGRAEGRELALLTYLRNLMETMNMSVDQAMNALKVPEESRGKLKNML